ncbi:macrophage mannose receptor 1-like [Anopheles stephensi]|uniref:macrophage mannose receptor 1-like n=1 Tax=Anopheles stephensi TaxID=30069 RepID=UPI001658B3A4|nr:macrophage mannose receptor 1-like [Anopheles stephensi]
MKTVLLALAIFGLAAVGLPTAQSLRYTAYKTKVSFFEAWQQCLAKGGSLASIELARQKEVVVAAMKKAGASDGWWISGTYVGLEGSWIWLSNNKPVGSIKGFVNFAPGEPNHLSTNGENCLITYNDGTWNDVDCGKTYYYICQSHST